VSRTRTRDAAWEQCLLEHLAPAARERGIDRFVADGAAEQPGDASVFRSAGYEVRRASPTATSRWTSRSARRRPPSRSCAPGSTAPRRDRSSACWPPLVAVIGASREPGAPGHELLKSSAYGFEGPVYPINPAATSVSGVRAYPDVTSVPDAVDLAVIAVPAADVADVRTRLRAQAGPWPGRGVRRLRGRRRGGRARLEEVVRLARAGGMRLIGPNAMGVVNTDPAIRLHATFAGTRAAGRPGRRAVAVRRAGRHLPGRGGAPLARAVGLRLDRGPGRRLRQRPAAALAGRPAHRGGGAATCRASATPASSPGSPAGSGAPSRWSRSRAGHGAGDVAVDALFASAGVVRVRSLGPAVHHRAAVRAAAAAAGPPRRGSSATLRARRHGRRRLREAGSSAGAAGPHRDRLRA
jgi:acetyltransferase